VERSSGFFPKNVCRLATNIARLVRLKSRREHLAVGFIVHLENFLRAQSWRPQCLAPAILRFHKLNLRSKYANSTL
jgi:hypothetical protein